MKTCKLRPLDDRVVVEPSKPKKCTAGGIVLPDTAKEKPQRGTRRSGRPGQAAGQRPSRHACRSPSATS